MPALFPASRGANACRRTLSLMMLPALLAAAHMGKAAPTSYSALPKELASSHAVGAVSSAQPVNLVLGLPVRDQQGLDNLIHRLYDPQDPLYGKYLTSAEFTDRFSPTVEQYDALAAYYQSRGFHVTGRHASRLLLDIAAPAATVSETFHVNLGYYRQPNGRIFYSADREPQIPAPDGVPVAAVVGLDNARVFQTHHKIAAPFMKSITDPQAGSGPFGGLTPSDIKQAYNLNPVSQTGAGQTLGLFELDGYNASDITAYEQAYNLRNVPLQDVFLPGFPGASGGNGQGEVTLDIELQIALAPGASQVIVYQGPNADTGVLDTYGKIADDNLAKSVSSSWGYHELGSTQLFLNQERAIFQKMAAQGQSFFAAAGDSGAYDDGSSLSVDDPASQPEVTGVGGTTLTFNGAYGGESAWGEPFTASGGGGGGGVSVVWPIPPYQAGFGFSSTARNVPDVSLDANPDTGYSIYVFGSWNVYGGTSCAAPLWSAFAALVDQKRVADGKTYLGLLNPHVYPIATSSLYSSAFHDINDNSNNFFYPATNGYDNATGLGTFNGLGLFAALTGFPNVPTNVVATAGSGQVALSWSGSPAATSYTVKRATVNGGPYFPISTLKTTNTINYGVSNGVTYYYIIVANDAAGQSPNSTQVSATPRQAVGINLTGVSIAPATVIAGTTTTGVVTISGPAPAGGISLRIGTSDSSIAAAPAYIEIAGGATTANFAIGTRPRFTAASATITAILDGASQSAALNVTPATAITNLSIAPASVVGGASAVGTITISMPAPTGGTAIRLVSSDATSAAAPAYVTIPAGARSTTFPVQTAFQSGPTSVTITGLLNGAGQTTTLGITATSFLSSLTISPAPVTAGSPTYGTVTLTQTAPAGGLAVRLTSSAPSSASVPASVTVPAGATTARFPITTYAGRAAQDVTITAALNGTSQSATITTTLVVGLLSLTIDPGTVASGGSATGTVTLSNAPTADAWITLASSDTYGAPVYAGVTVRAGVTTATFPINTRAGLTARLETITATYNSVNKSARLTVTAH